MDYRDVWNSLYLEHVDPHKYLYHYTTVNSAIKILYGDTLSRYGQCGLGCNIKKHFTCM